jgi:transcriptional regulator with XRE-family HTH domain
MMISKLLAAYRKANNISIRKMAQIIGVQWMAYYRFERGSTATNETLNKVFRFIFSL